MAFWLILLSGGLLIGAIGLFVKWSRRLEAAPLIGEALSLAAGSRPNRSPR